MTAIFKRINSAVKQPMVRLVFTDYEIGGAIVGWISVDMVNDGLTGQDVAQSPLCHQAVLKYVSVPIGLRVPRPDQDPYVTAM